MTDNGSRRNPRLRLACARCQRRKIRCDGEHPTCSNCRKASAECFDGGSIRLRNGPQERNAERTEMKRLRKRVRALESIVRERLPDVNLTTVGYPELHEVADEDERATAEGTSSPNWHISRDASVVNIAELQSAAVPDQRAHEIGLISVGCNADQKYIGPSSGYFLARLLLAKSRRDGEPDCNVRRPTATPQTSINDLVSAIQGPLPLPPQELAMQLCQVYFETVQPQFPILHEGSFRAALTRLYSTDGINRGSHEEPATVHFQVFMVLAISASIWAWRSKRHIPAESYCLSALQYLDRIDVGISLSGLQCMVLLLIFTMHCPHMKLNVWYMNYQCIASVLDLGLQREVTTSLGISLIEQELRTRIFWSVFTIDRTIATMMGRPIGLRDEACELRLPQFLNDGGTIDDPVTPRSQICDLACSVHLFKLARLNSEIKYVANSIVRDVPSYAYPPIQDVIAWQNDMLQRLDDWAENIPDSQNEFLKATSKLRYHSVRMVLLRPSPAIPSPGTGVLCHCHASARDSIRLYHHLYNRDLLSHDWITLHGVVLSLVTILYCTRAVPGIARTMDDEDLMSDISVGLSILSATGEHWTGAKRAREILAELGQSTIRWHKRNSKQGPRIDAVGDEQVATQSLPFDANATTPAPGFDLNLPGIQSGIQMDASLFPELQQDPFGDIINLEDIMRNLFDDFIPRLDSI
ncbi:fungal-specific transcription factor domain-containing protein [Boeremia exigua]|uniref:fungal-specific transcription factor domain-containing protein n=1 Tax=Boeremia exigua TaxID=749465 RepID=UPI001E8CA4F1|nr:fungal-specific transcription factor domain-containing protein [Boeremia exigua]KAH6622005.1 fungal-specific transcription factor domain-containing protein [Boeremia exigua]